MDVGMLTRGAILFVSALASLALATSVHASSGVHEPKFCRVSTALAAHHSSSGQVGKATPDGVSLLVSPGAIKPGRAVYARLANFSEMTGSTGSEFAIQRLTSVGWQLDPASPDGPWPKTLRKLKPGAASPCYVFEVPTDQKAGQYRFSTKVQLAYGTKRGLEHKTATFDVVGEGSKASTAPFCSSPIVRDYEARLRDLPADEPVPADLPFGPSEVLVRRATPWPEFTPYGGHHDRLRYWKTASGFRLANQSSGEVQLGWRVQIGVFRIDASGASLVTDLTTEISGLPPHGSEWVSEPRLSELGSFRIDTRFLDGDGNLLRTYSQYVQVVQDWTKYAIRFKDRQVPAGATLDVRLENLGTGSIRYGGNLIVQHYQDHDWREVPAWAMQFTPSRYLPPGQTTHCQRVRVPMAAGPGLYRLGKRASAIYNRDGKRRILVKPVFAAFRVVEP
jgi:hypothetical protein